MGRTDFFHDERAPKPNSLVPAAGVQVEATGLLAIYSDPGYILAYDDHTGPSRYGEIRQESEITLIGRPLAGAPAVNDEADAVRWFHPDELAALDVHPGMRRQLADYLAGVRGRIE